MNWPAFALRRQRFPVRIITFRILSVLFRYELMIGGGRLAASYLTGQDPEATGNL